MSGVKRRQRQVSDRPSGWRLLLRRQKRRVVPALCVLLAFVLLIGAGIVWRGIRLHSSIAAVREQIGSAIGMKVAAIDIEGRASTPEPLLRAALGIDRGDPILGVSIDGARARIESLSWVESVAVERRLPDTIVVKLVERSPVAVWQNQGHFMLIDKTGQVVADQDHASQKDWQEFAQLPLVVGPGAPASTASLLDLLAKEPTLKSRIAASVRVAERRWNLVLKNGPTIMLPEIAEAAALARIEDLQTSDQVLDRQIAAIDMRLGDRMVLRKQANAPSPSDSDLPIPPIEPPPGPADARGPT